MHEQIARTVYYAGIHLLYASLVGCAAWALTSVRHATATAKYWIWVIAAFNFIVPAGAIVDKLSASHLAWAAPLSVIGQMAWKATDGSTAIVLGMAWSFGAFVMSMRLLFRLRLERREIARRWNLETRHAGQEFRWHGVRVRVDRSHRGPTVLGVFRQHISLPSDIDCLLSQQELEAVLLHELAHARRRDNLIRLAYELVRCALWFHPLVWLAGRRMALYRELSCDESVIRYVSGGDLVSALAKLAVPEGRVLQATASSHLSHRLARLAGSPQPISRLASTVLIMLFCVVLAGGVFETVAHTACCFLLKR